MKIHLYTFLLPGIFLLVLGAGNITVGHYKGVQYSNVLKELSQFKSSSEDTTYPLLRIKEDKLVKERSREMVFKAEQRQELYSMVYVTGQFFAALGLFLISASMVVRFFRKSPKRYKITI